MTVRYQSQNRGVFRFASTARLGDANPPITKENLAVLGHEIRNPLSALTYALQAWPDGNDDPQLSEQLLQMMRRQVSQLTRLCNDLLDTERSERGNLSIHWGFVDLAQTIRNACDEVRPLIEKFGHTIAIGRCDFAFTLVGDESRLTQVFANVMHNFAKFTDRNGRLDITLEKEQDSVVIRFRDNGPGISVADLRNIFHSDNASNGCSKAKCDGLGIGLRLAKAIIELHGGTIDAFSDGLGHGSTFEVRLPMETDQLSIGGKIPEPTGSAREESASILPNYRIVIVDDDRSIRFLMSRLLQKLGQSVSVAESGSEAVEMIMKNPPHIVFLDLQMCDVSGFEVARKIRSCAELNDVVLVALSGCSDSNSSRLAAESGFDRYLVKPTSIAELTEVLCSSKLAGTS